MSAPVPTLRIDTSGTAFGTSPTWTDRTSYLMTGSQYPVDITFGRQDEQSEPQPSTCSLFLSNADGYWTPGAGVGPAAWDIGCPVNVQLTASAVTYDRFTGFVDSIEPTWPGGVQSWSVVKVTATDVSARLGIAKPLRSLLLQEMLADSPTYLYPLDEAAGATSAGSITGSSGPAVARDANGGGSANFGSNTGLFDGGTGVDFSGNIDGPAGGYESPLTYLDVPTLAPAAAAFTIEQWVITPTTLPQLAQYPFAEDRPDPAFDNWGIIQFAFDTSGFAYFGLRDASQTQLIGGNTNMFDGQIHHLVGVLDADRKTSRLYVDGAQVATATAAGAFSFQTPGVAAIGASHNPQTGFYFDPFTGSVSHHALYPSALSAARVLAHYQAGIGTGPVERSDQRFSRIAGYGGISVAGLPTGLATMGGQKAAGATAIEALRKVARTEGTVAYVTPSGVLTFQGRQVRYHGTSGVDPLPAAEIAPPGVRRDRQGIANEIGVNREGGATQVVIDAASQTAIGRFDGGSFEVCPSTDEDAWQNATWQVQNRKTTRTRMPDLTVDLYRQTSPTIVAGCLGIDISSKLWITGLPANAPASSMTLFVEGYTETIGYDRWSMSFFTSPVGLEDSVLVLDSSTVGLLDTNLLAF